MCSVVRPSVSSLSRPVGLVSITNCIRTAAHHELMLLCLVYKDVNSMLCHFMLGDDRVHAIVDLAAEFFSASTDHVSVK